jgi:hypothetical protein
MESLGLQPDPWQLKVLEEPQPRLLLNCSRQAGKSTVVAALALAEAMLVNYTLVLLNLAQVPPVARAFPHPRRIPPPHRSPAPLPPQRR